MRDRFDFADLERLLGTGASGTAAHLGVDVRQVHRLRARGLTVDEAHDYAGRARLHPFEVWPELVDAEIEAAKMTCPWCNERFVPHTARQRFCCPRHQRYWNTARYKATPAGAEANRRARRAYYEAHGDYERARQRRADLERRRRQSEAA
jgi:hypothetical protein